MLNESIREVSMYSLAMYDLVCWSLKKVLSREKTLNNNGTLNGTSSNFVDYPGFPPIIPVLYFVPGSAYSSENYASIMCSTPAIAIATIML